MSGLRAFAERQRDECRAARNITAGVAIVFLAAAVLTAIFPPEPGFFIIALLVAAIFGAVSFAYHGTYKKYVRLFQDNIL